MNAAATHAVTLGGETILVTPDNFKELTDALVAKHGGVPKVVDLKAVPASLAPQVLETIQAAPVRGVTVSEVGNLRSLQDEALAKANGFAPAKPLYSRGTMVVDVGVENARESRLEHEKKPLVEDACRDFIRTIQLEGRKDMTFEKRVLRMNKDGRLVSMEGDRVTPIGPLSGNAFGSLLSLAGIGGHSYLDRCPSRLRSLNVNNWLASLDGLPEQKGGLKLRTRAGASGREVFAAVSSGYASFDADLVAAGVASTLAGKGARGTVHYDGFRTRIEAVYHSDVQPEDYVAGEFFKAGVIVRTDDTGSGSLKVSACLWQNLCLNLIIIDQAEQTVDAIRHVGHPEKMAVRFVESLAVAQDKIAGFVKQWGHACHDDVRLPRHHDKESIVLPIEQMIPGFFNGIIERELVPVRGRRQDVVKQLVAMHDKDQSGATASAPATRASLVNAFTRWAHECNDDAFFGDDVSRAAGALAQSHNPLPFLPIEIKG